MITRSALLLPALALLLAGCGRTPMDAFTDGGGPPRRDAELPVDGDVPECARDADCDDGLVCNGGESCRSGTCVSGMGVRCDDGIGCTIDRCVEAAGGCESVPDSALCPRGEVCEFGVGCMRRSCMADFECDDGFVCNGTELCTAGACAGGLPPRCDDGIGCTIDECSEAAGGCAARGDHRRCTDGVFCNGMELCVPEAGGCRSTMPVTCDDGDRCTTDRCNEGTDRCDHIPVPDPSCMPPGCPDQDIGSRIGPSVATGTTRGAGNDLSGSCGGSGAPERTIRWTAPFGATWTFTTTGSSYDTLIYLRRSCTGGELPGMCNDDSGGTLQSSLTTFVGAGESIVIVVDGFGSNEGSYVLNIREGGIMCEPFESSCLDGLDNDCDGLFDCADSDCARLPECMAPCAVTEFDCFDGIDNDCDGSFDCADRECRFDPICCSMRPEICNNRLDDDCDGLVDCADADCRFSLSCRSDAGPPDGGTDAGPLDGGMCTSRELGVTQCTDRLDNDCDGARDCRDTDCSPFGPMGECCNGTDDDGDGQIDLFTCRCFSDAECRTVGSLEQVCWTETYSVCAPRCNFYGGDAFCRSIDPSLRCNATTGHCVPSSSGGGTP